MNKIIISFLILIFIISCNSDDGIVMPPDIYPPVVSGIWRTAENGAVLGKLGKPNDKRSGINLSTLGIYPNPAQSEFKITFTLSFSVKVSVWITPANISDGLFSELTGLNHIMIPNSLNTVLCFSGLLKPGNYTQLYNIGEIFKNKVQSSFYRIYLIADEEVQWIDLMVY